MRAMLFDTQEAIEELTTAGVPDKEARAIVNVMKSRESDLVTKADLELLKNDLFIKLLGTVSAGVAVLFALLQLFPPGVFLSS